MRAKVAVVSLAAILLLAGHLWIGLRTDWVPCSLDCGESFEAYVGGRNLDRFGWLFAGGLQDFAAGSDPVAHPTVYAHNSNIGMYYFALLGALGLRSVAAQSAALTLPFLLGMLYLFLAVRAVTRDAFFAGLVLLNASTLYLLVALWGFSAVRTWGWMIAWGAVYHVVQWSRAGTHD